MFCNMTLSKYYDRKRFKGKWHTFKKLFASFHKGRIEYKRGETNVYFP